MIGSSTNIYAGISSSESKSICDEFFEVDMNRSVSASSPPSHDGQDGTNLNANSDGKYDHNSNNRADEKDKQSSNISYNTSNTNSNNMNLGPGGLTISIESPSPSPSLQLQTMPLSLPMPPPSEHTLDLSIEEGTPAAEALRANKDVRVSKLSKFARAAHAQSIRRVVKHGVLLRQSSGNRRGKPPRVPIIADLDHVDASLGTTLEDDAFAEYKPWTAGMKSSGLKHVIEEDDEISSSNFSDTASHANSLNGLAPASLDAALDAHTKTNAHVNVTANANANASAQLKHPPPTLESNTSNSPSNDTDNLVTTNQESTTKAAHVPPLVAATTTSTASPNAAPKKSLISSTDNQDATILPTQNEHGEAGEETTVHDTPLPIGAATIPHILKPSKPKTVSIKDEFNNDILVSASSFDKDIPSLKDKSCIKDSVSTIQSDSDDAAKAQNSKKKHVTIMESDDKKKSKTKSTSLLKKDGIFFKDAEKKKLKKRKKKAKKNARKSYVKGKVIDGEHELYTLSIAMMVGLKCSIKFTNDELSQDLKNGRWLDKDDFMRVEKYLFPPGGGKKFYKTPPHQLSHTFKFKDYSPLAFIYIRRMFGVNEVEFMQSVCGNANYIEFISNAKSGQFFFYSYDGKYLIKTMTNAESKFLRRILPHYFRHCAQNPNTLIPKFFGMYRVKLYHLRRNVKFVIMNSVFDTHKVLQSFYDLKGSKIGRDAKPGQDVKKDNDVRRGFPNSAFSLTKDLRLRMRNQVLRDCTFMKEMNIMDYSMLVGIHHIPTKVRGSSNSVIRGLSFKDPTSFIRNQKDSLKRTGIMKPSRAMSEPPIPAARLKSLPALRAKSEKIRERSKSYLDGTGLKPSLGVNDETSKENIESSPVSEKKIIGDMDSHATPVSLNRSVQSADHPAPSPMVYSETGTRVEDMDRSIASYSTTDYYFDETDDESYLDSGRVRARGTGDHEDYENYDEFYHNKDINEANLKLEEATEKVLWPFQRFYDAEGRRRMIPMSFKKPSNEAEEDPNVNEKDERVSCNSCLGDVKSYDPDLEAARLKWSLTDFEKPISNRRDGGLIMDVEGLKLPLKFQYDGKIQYYDGKIFYMGIIDILQQFNVRKRLEARWRRFGGAGWEDASCVHPELYADRFIRFFDEYTQSSVPDVDETEHHANVNNEVEEIAFSASKPENVDRNKTI